MTESKSAGRKGAINRLRGRLLTVAVLGLGGVFALASLSASATTQSGVTNGKIAVAKFDGHGHALVGIVTPNRKVRNLFTPSTVDAVFDPSYSQDGKRIVFTFLYGTPGGSLGVVNLETGGFREIKTTPIGSIETPAYLPNGEIVFTGTNGGGQLPHTFAMKPNSANLHKLFNRPEEAVSDDGRWFITHDLAGATMFLVDSEGNKVRQLARGLSGFNRNADFSPNGRQIVFERTVEGGKHAPSNIYLIHRDGTHLRRLTHGGHAAEPTFSPNGRWIAFRRSNDGIGGNVAAFPLSHPSKRRVLTGVRGAQFHDPAWGPQRRRH